MQSITPVLLLISVALAAPRLDTEHGLRDGNRIPNEAAYVECMKHHYPKFPNEDTLDAAIVTACGGDGKSLLQARNEHDLSSTPKLRLRDDAMVQTEWVESDFMKCMKNTYPGFPSQTATNPEDILKCRGAGGPKGKRQVSASRSIDFFKGRVEFTPECSGEEIPKNFKEAAPFRAEGKKWCKAMKWGALKIGSTIVSDKIPDAVTKKASWLHRNRPVMFTTAFVFTKQGQEILNEYDARNAPEIYDRLCSVAFDIFGTKGQGCTGELGYYSSPPPLLFRKATTTAVTDGSISFRNGSTPIGNLLVGWSETGQEKVETKAKELIEMYS